MKKIILMLGLILTLFTSSVSAEEFIIEADGYHTVSRKETILEAEEAAVNDALRWAVEQIGVRISAYSEVVNKVLKEDTVQRFASSVVKIKEKTLTPKVMNDDYRIYAHVVCVVNTDDLDRWEPPDVERQRRLEEDKKRLEKERDDRELELWYYRANAVAQEGVEVMNENYSNRHKVETVKGNPTVAKQHLQKADSLLREGKMNDAIKEYQVAWEANPKDAIPMYRIAAILWNNKNYFRFYHIVDATEKCNNNDWYYKIWNWLSDISEKKENAPEHIDLIQYIADPTTTVPREGHGL